MSTASESHLVKIEVRAERRRIRRRKIEKMYQGNKDINRPKHERAAVMGVDHPSGLAQRLGWPGLAHRTGCMHE